MPTTANPSLRKRSSARNQRLHATTTTWLHRIQTSRCGFLDWLRTDWVSASTSHGQLHLCFGVLWGTPESEEGLVLFPSARRCYTSLPFPDSTSSTRGQANVALHPNPFSRDLEDPQLLIFTAPEHESLHAPRLVPRASVKQSTAWPPQGGGDVARADRKSLCGRHPQVQEAQFKHPPLQDSAGTRCNFSELLDAPERT